MDPDLPLIHALQSGDDSALNELIMRHRGPLFHFAFRMMRNEAAASDIVQEAFVRAYFAAARFKPRATVKTWLYSIALNVNQRNPFTHVTASSIRPARATNPSGVTTSTRTPSSAGSLPNPV